MSQTRKLTDVYRLDNPLGVKLEFTGCQLSAQDIEPGNLFIAVQGQKRHGIEFLDQAIASGAVAVLTDPDNLPPVNFPYLLSPEPKAIAGQVANDLYGTSAADMRLFGVTGTNGKTSTATYVQQLLIALGVPSGLSASTGRIVGGKVLTASLTTPESPKLHWLLAKMREAGQFAAAIEVSAQALVRNRVDGLTFETVGFTNLSRDHLDDFESMDEYLSAKARLFTRERAVRAVVMVDDQYGQKLAEKITQIPVSTLGENSGDWRYEYLDGRLGITDPHGIQISTDFGAGSLMAKNFAVAIVMLAVSGFGLDVLSTALSNAQAQVPGRLERVSQQTPAVFVDYAHTPAGVRGAVTEMLSRHPELVVVLGASGNRDQGKRADMALATLGAKLLVVTDQHPRDEDPKLIRATLMAAAISSGIPAVEIPEPAEAIKYAISQIESDGAVLWCGPGNLSYREVRGAHLPFDARAIAKKLVEHD